VNVSLETGGVMVGKILSIEIEAEAVAVEDAEESA
jgi:hypothetical protein